MIRLQHIYFEGLKQRNDNKYLTIEEVMVDFNNNRDVDEGCLIFKATIGNHIIEEWWDAHTMKQEYKRYLNEHT